MTFSLLDVVLMNGTHPFTVIREVDTVLHITLHSLTYVDRFTEDQIKLKKRQRLPVTQWRRR